MPNLQELIGRRSELKSELERVEAAIAAFADATPVRIRTRRNLRNTGWVSTNPDCGPDILLVFADPELTIPAPSRNDEGWVVRSAWAQFQMDHPDMVGEYIWEE